MSNWPVGTRLGAIFVAASVMGVVFGTLRITQAIATANSDARTVQLATLGGQVATLTQALENERDLQVGVAAYSTLKAAATSYDAGPSVVGPLKKALASENRRLATAQRASNAAAAATRRLAARVGTAFSESTQVKAANVIGQLSNVGGLRAAMANVAPPDIITNYQGTLNDLFSLEDEIANQSGDPALSDEVRALGALSRAKDEATIQRAILYGAFIENGHPDIGGKPAAKTAATPAGKAARKAARQLDPTGAPKDTLSGNPALDAVGGLQALTSAQNIELTYLLQFQSAATPAQAADYLTTVTGPAVNMAQVIEYVVIAPVVPAVPLDNVFMHTATHQSLGLTPATATAAWYTDMTAMVTRMRTVEKRLATAILVRSQQLQRQAVDSARLSTIVTVAAVLIVLIGTALISRSLVNPLRRLQADALDIATVRLPARVAAAASGVDPPDGDQGDAGEDGQAGQGGAIEPVAVYSTDEIGRVARAFDQVHAEAVRLASTEAQLRGNLNAMFISLSRRSVPLIERLARMIDAMEQNEDNPGRLGGLFAMDHLVTRMRRNSENLLVLAGEEPVRKWSEPVPLTDVVRAAAAEIEQYDRVMLTIQPRIVVSGHAAADIVHLLAELIENATLFSPRASQVRVTAQELSTGGILIEVGDEGVGISANRLTEMNWRLDHPPEVDVSVSRHMGLFAVSRLAARHGIRIRLRAGMPQGLSALVWLPTSLTSQEPRTSTGSYLGPADGSPAADGTGLAGDAAGARFAMAPGAAPDSLPSRNSGRHRIGIAAQAEGPREIPARQAPEPEPTSAWFSAQHVPGQDLPAFRADSWADNWPGASYPGGTAARQGTPWQASAQAGSRRTSSGLPLRVPQTSTFTGPDDAYGMTADGVPVPGVPPAAPQEAAPATPRRSAEAIRRRTSGFQLGSRDAARAARLGLAERRPNQAFSRQAFSGEEASQ